MLADKRSMKRVFGLSDKQADDLRKSFTESNLKILQAEGIDKSVVDKIRGHKHLTTGEEAQIAMRLPGSNNMSPAELAATGAGFVASLQGRRGGRGNAGDRATDEATQSVTNAAQGLGIARGTEEEDVLKFMETRGGRVRTSKELMEEYKKTTPEERSKLKQMANREKDALTSANGPQTDVDKAMSHFITVLNGAAASIESAFKTHGMTVGGAN